MAWPTAAFVHDTQWAFPEQACEARLRAAVGVDALGLLDAEQVACQALGDAIYTNPLLLGFAWQQGRVPLSHASLMCAMELNGVHVANNQAAFEWGRHCAHDLAAVQALLEAVQVIEFVKKPSVTEIVAKRVAYLTAYQNAAYADQYKTQVEQALRVDAVWGKAAFSEAVARSLFKLMAVKDEYEVARLYSDGVFANQLASQFEGDYSLQFHLAPPLWARTNEKGESVKRPFGPATMTAFQWLARLKGLRGTALDIFGCTAERRTERALIMQYRAMLAEWLSVLYGGSEQAHADELYFVALEMACVPEEIRGFGHVKAQYLTKAQDKWYALRVRLAILSGH